MDRESRRFVDRLAQSCHRIAAYSIVIAAVSVCAELLPAAVSTVNITFKSDSGEQACNGEILVQYSDGSLLLLTDDGQLWTLTPDQIVHQSDIDGPMHVRTSDEIYDQFKEQLPAGFKVYKTRHYVLVYNTSDVYVRWVAELYERLYTRFYNYWKSRGIRLHEPRFPLVAVVFSNKATYLSYAEREIGESAKAMIGYYNMKTNRMISFDMTGVDGLVPAGTNISNSRVIQQILSRPQAERTVATIVHEAVHQLAFNSGLQTRLADNPLWLSEGIAMFFESPDGNDSKGWGTIGKVNQHNLRLFAQNFHKRSPDSLLSLITDDDRLRKSTTAAAAYPESWALTYFLMRTKSKEFTSYLQELSELPPLEEVEDRKRIETFKKHFGDDLDQLDAAFLAYIRSLW